MKFIKKIVKGLFLLSVTGCLVSITGCEVTGALTAPAKKDMDIVGKTREEIHATFGEPFSVQKITDNLTLELFQFYMGQDMGDRLKNVTGGILATGLSAGTYALFSAAGRYGTTEDKWNPSSMEVVFENGVVKRVVMLKLKKLTHEFACERLYGASCFELKQYDKGCDIGHAESCKKVVSNYDSACRRGSYHDCEKLLVIYSNTLADKEKAQVYRQILKNEDAKRIRSLKEEAALKAAPCKRGDAKNCLDVARQYWNGTYWDGTKKIKSKEKATEYFNYGCQLGNGVSCFNLANIKAEAKQTKEARELYMKACDKKVADGCIVLAEEKYENKDFKAAKTYYDKACKAGSKEGCSERNSLGNQGF